MTTQLELFSHPIAAYCWKVLVALRELGARFETPLVDLSKDEVRAEFRRMSPFGKMPVLRDRATGATVFESTIIIDYLARTLGDARLRTEDPDVRLWDRLFDGYVTEPMQQIVASIRAGTGDAAPGPRATLATAYDYLEQRLADGRTWVCGDAFTMADCAAMPALFYGHCVAPIAQPHVRAYARRLTERPSAAQTLRDAEPLLHLFPGTLRRP
jgi:glutathione S-transferase